MPKQLALYNPGKDQNGKAWEPELLAPHVDRFIMTPGVDREAFARAMMAVNPAIEFHMYLLQHSAHLALPGTPFNNQILTRRGEAESLLKQQAAIALHEAESGLVILKNKELNYFVANTAHPIWRKLFPERVAEVKKRAPFFTRLWLDDVGTESRFNQVGYKTVKEFPTRELYFNHTCDWLTYARQNAALANGLRFGCNLQAPTEQFEDWKRAAGIMLVSGGDVLIEFAWMDWEGKLTKYNWENTFQKADFVTRNGGQLNTIIQRDPRKLTDLKSQAYREFEFALYSQMLVSNGQDGMRVADQYEYFVDIPAIRGIDALLGKPKGDYRKEGDYYVRDFEKYGIAVNPTTFEHKLVEPPIIVNPVPSERDLMIAAIRELAGTLTTLADNLEALA